MAEIRALQPQSQQLAFWQYYCLTRDPFVDDQNSNIYSVPERDQLSELLYHFVCYSNVAVMLLGESGIGKSVFLKKWFKTADRQTVRPYFFQAHSQLRMDEIPKLLSDAFDIPMPENGDISARIQQQVDYMQKQSLFHVLLIDDADQLPDAVLQALIQPIKDQPEPYNFHLVLSGTLSFQDKMQKIVATMSMDAYIHAMIMEPFTQAQLSDYIKNAFKITDPKGDFPFKEKELEIFFQKSKGHPGLLPEILQAWITEINTSSPKSTVGFNAKLKKHYLKILLGVVLLSGAGVSSWMATKLQAKNAVKVPHAENKSSLKSAAELIEAKKPAVTLPEKPAVTKPEDLGIQSMAEIPAMPIKLASAQLPEVILKKNPPAIYQPIIPASVVLPNIPLVHPRSIPVKTALAVIPRMVPVKSKVFVKPVEHKKTAIKKIILPLKIKHSSAKVKVVKKPQKIAIPSIVKRDAALSHMRLADVTGSIYHDSQTAEIMTRHQVAKPGSRSYYTIQLITARQAKSIVALRRYHLPAPMEGYTIRRSDGVWYGVNYGRYTTENAAKIALTHLPASLRASGAKIKKMNH